LLLREDTNGLNHLNPVAFVTEVLKSPLNRRRQSTNIKLISGAEYEALKKKLGENLLQMLYSLFPEAKDKIAHIDVATPLSNNYYIGSYRGWFISGCP